MVVFCSALEDDLIACHSTEVGRRDEDLLDGAYLGVSDADVDGASVVAGFVGGAAFVGAGVVLEGGGYVEVASEEGVLKGLPTVVTE